MPTPAGNHSITTTRVFFIVVRIFLVGLSLFGGSIDAVPGVRSRRMKSVKSPKSPKSPKIPKYLQLPEETCLVTGFVIKGTSVEQTGDTNERIFDACSSFTGSDFEDCVLDLFLETAFSAPFRYELNGATATLQFTTDESLLGEGSFKGSIPDGSMEPTDKVILSYFSTEYIQGVNDELWNRPVSDLDYIEYSFKVEACGGIQTSCPKQFYLNVYTRSVASETEFYSCRYDFLPTEGGEEGGEWTTVRFDLTIAADTIVSRPGTDGCPTPLGDKTLQNAANNDYVLGTNEQFSQYSPSDAAAVIFSLNMGDTSSNDNGLLGYFDRVIVKMQGEDAWVFDLEP